jgi:parvulin-like peptidyl-prolyl isomerase
VPKQHRNTKNKHTVSSNRQSVPQRQKRWRNIFIIAGLVVILVVAGIVGWAANNHQAQSNNQAAINFNGVTLDMQYFINMLKVYYGKAPPDSTITEFADFVVQQIEQNETIIQGSAALGVEIKRSDIAAELKKAGTPATRESIDAAMAQALVAKQVPGNQPQVHVQAMLLESETAAQAAKARVQAGEAFGIVAVELSKIANTDITSDLGWVTARQADVTVNSTIFGAIVSSANVAVLSGPEYDKSASKRFGYWVVKAVEMSSANETSPAKAHIEGILVGNEQEAKDVIAKLNAGGDINELARQLSQIPGAAANGAEIGWVQKSETNPFPSLFDLPLNTVSGPISDNNLETKGGYWVFNVLEKNDNMALTDTQQTTLEKDLLDRCTAELKKDPNYKVENLLTRDMKDLALDAVVVSQGEGSVLIGTISLPDSEVGVSYSQKLVSYGNKIGNTWSITEGTLPDGITLDKSTGVISGVPEFAGANGFTVQVTNSLHYSTQDLYIRIRIPVSVTTSSMPDGQVGVKYIQVLEAQGEDNSYKWSIVAGSLPAGLTLADVTGVISGTPTTAGTFSFTLQVDDGYVKATQALTIVVK